MSKPEPLAYAVERAAKRMNICESTPRLMIRNKEIKVVSRGTTVLPLRQMVLDWLKHHER